MRYRSSVKILPPNENSHSTDALDGIDQCLESHTVSLCTDTPSGYLALLHHHEKMSRLPDEDRLQDYEFVHFVVPVVSL